MGLVDQVILAVYTIGLTVLSVLLVVVALGWLEPLQLLEQVLADPGGRWAVGLVGALFFVTGVRLAGLVFRRRGPGGMLVRQTDLGEVQVAVGAIEQFVARVGRQVDGVRELKARVGGGERGIQVQL
ncbi:MAG TPA: hypothetical protein VIL95_07520, partial [Bacillota bacterium]